MNPLILFRDLRTRVPRMTICEIVILCDRLGEGEGVT